MYVRSALHFHLANQPMSWDSHILASLPMVMFAMVANILILVLGRLIHVVYNFYIELGYRLSLNTRILYHF